MFGVWEAEKINPSGPEKEYLPIWTAREYFRTWLMLCLKLPAWAVQRLFFFIPLKQDQMIIYSLKQHGYCCNLKYLTEYIRKNRGEGFRLCWIVRDKESWRQLKRAGVPVLPLHSLRHWIFRHRSKVVITNDEFYPVCLKRRGQLYVNTWHGGINYKKIGYTGLGFTNRLQRLVYQMNNPQPDIFVSGSRSFTESTSAAFGFSKKIFLDCGLPRNDIFFRDWGTVSIQTKRKLGISETTRLLLYAPTFRKGKTRPEREPDFKNLVHVLEKRFGGVWKILCRYHYFSAERNRTLKDSEILFDVSQYEDMQELILCSDCMISDYSSCMWDFSYTEKPCFVYAPDLLEYMKNDRSFTILPSQWPYPICQEPEQLYRAILEFDETVYKKKLRQHRKEMGSFDRGDACRSLIEEINLRRRGKTL